MNNTFKTRIELEKSIPTSSMVGHEKVTCTVEKHTIDLLFLLQDVENHLLPMILEDDLGVAVVIFVDQDGGEWVKQSDVVRNAIDRMGDSYEFAHLMDDIESSKLKILKMFRNQETIPPPSFEKLQQVLIAKLAELSLASESYQMPDVNNIEGYLSIVRNCKIIDSIYDWVGFPFFGDRDIPSIQREISVLNNISKSGVANIKQMIVNTLSKGFDRVKIFNEVYEFVYIFDIGDKIKIGKSANPYRRIADFHDIFGFRLDSFFLCDKSKIIETKSHYFAIGSILSGEYFKKDCMDGVRTFLEENSILSFDSKGSVYKDNSLNGSNIKRFSDLSDFIKK